MEPINLNKPVNDGGVEFSTLTMREPTVRDQMISDKQGTTDAEKEIKLFASLCQISPEAIMSLTMKDYKKLQVAYGNFLK